MKLQPLSNCQFDVQPRDDGDSFLLRLRMGPMTFTLSEFEGLRLANAIADAVGKQRDRRDKVTDQ